MTAQETLKARQNLAASLPWITRLKKARQCQGFVGSRRKSDCQKDAYWKYKFSKKGYLFGTGPDAMYFCWSHLISRGLYSNPHEYQRTADWINAHSKE